MNESKLCVVKITQGGAIAAPIAAQILGEVLPYLEVQKSNSEEENNTSLVEMPEVIGMTVNEAKKVIKELGLEITIEGEGEYITNQLPKKGIQINAGTKVIVYSN